MKCHIMSFGQGPIVIDEYFDFYDPYTKRAEARPGIFGAPRALGIPSPGSAID